MKRCISESSLQKHRGVILRTARKTEGTRYGREERIDVFTTCEKNGCRKEIDVKEEKQFKGREK